MLATATYPKKRALGLQRAYWVVACSIVVATVFQLFKFENMPAFYAKYFSFWPIEMHTITAAIIVVLQLFALPFLLGMRTSVALRAAGAVFCVLVCVFWLIVGFVVLS